MSFRLNTKVNGEIDRFSRAGWYLTNPFAKPMTIVGTPLRTVATDVSCARAVVQEVFSVKPVQDVHVSGMREFEVFAPRASAQAIFVSGAFTSDVFAANAEASEVFQPDATAEVYEPGTSSDDVFVPGEVATESHDAGADESDTSSGGAEAGDA